jgi:O-acetyl-ADP-ribose deacetylase (regulator of RNase III)
VYGYPPRAAAEIAVRESRHFVATNDVVQKLFFVCFGEEIERAYREILRN